MPMMKGTGGGFEHGPNVRNINCKKNNQKTAERTRKGPERVANHQESCMDGRKGPGEDPNEAKLPKRDLLPPLTDLHSQPHPQWPSDLSAWFNTESG